MNKRSIVLPTRQPRVLIIPLLRTRRLELIITPLIILADREYGIAIEALPRRGNWFLWLRRRQRGHVAVFVALARRGIVTWWAVVRAVFFVERVSQRCDFEALVVLRDLWSVSRLYDAS